MDWQEFKKAFREIGDQKEEKWIGKLAEMIRIDSQIGNEAGMSEFAGRELESLGAECESFDIPADIIPGREMPEWMFRDRPNVVGVVRGGGTEGRSLILSCHMDTQPVYPREFWSHDPLGAEIEDGRIYGRGALDNKAGIAVVLCLLDCLKEMRVLPGGELIVEFVVEDETTGVGTLACVERGYKADGAIIVDGTDLDNAFYSHPGHICFKVEIFGTPTTSASTFRAVNPLTASMPIVEALKGIESDLRREDPGDFSSTAQPVNLNLFFGECGFTTGAVPSRAILCGDLSFCPPWTVEKLKVKIRDAVRGAWTGDSADKAPPPSVEFGGYICDPTISDAGSELAGALRSSAKEMLGIDVAMRPMRGYADLRHLIEMTRGNCFLYGPGSGGGVHINDEYYVLGDMKKCIGVLAGVVFKWCGLQRGG